MISGLKLNTMSCALPNIGTILGGTMDLHGYNISLACFHGINFRSKAWAIFSMRKPTISFATEAQDVVQEDGKFFKMIYCVVLKSLICFSELNKIYIKLFQINFYKLFCEF